MAKNLSSFNPDLAANIRNVRTQAASTVTSIDQQITTLTQQQRALHAQVSVADAAALIASSIKTNIAEARIQLSREAARSVRLESHASVSYVAGLDGNGDAEFSVSKPVCLNIPSRDIHAFQMVALLMTDAQIDAFAQKSAIECGAIPSGRTVADLKAESDNLHQQIVSLYQQRKEAGLALEALSNVELAASALIS
jgi:hypothetical protein